MYKLYSPRLHSDLLRATEPSWVRIFACLPFRFSRSQAVGRNMVVLTLDGGSLQVTLTLD